jgi:hypothetical protein
MFPPPSRCDTSASGGHKRKKGINDNWGKIMKIHIQGNLIIVAEPEKSSGKKKPAKPSCQQAGTDSQKLESSEMQSERDELIAAIAAEMSDGCNPQTLAGIGLPRTNNKKKRDFDKIHNGIT